eukprot:gene10686-11822_t
MPDSSKTNLIVKTSSSGLIVDEVLLVVGEFGRFQILLTIILAVIRIGSQYRCPYYCPTSHNMILVGGVPLTVPHAS